MLKSQGILTIDQRALQANYARLRQETGPGAVTGAVLKANGYGLGAVEVARTLSEAGCADFFVSSVEEGLSLRAVLKTPRILILNGFYGSAADIYAEHNLVPIMGSFMEIEAYKRLAAKCGRKLEAWLSFNTRMNRLGLGAVETDKLLSDMAMLDGIHISGIISHFACADEKGHPMNEVQYEVFDDIARKIGAHLPGVQKSLSNSSGIFRDRKYHYDVLRPGMALYGLNPTPETVNPMRPVVSLSLPVIRVRLVYKGASVGYGATWTAEKDTPLATVSAGYADGIPRALSNKGALYWKGYRCPIVGRVSMDLTTVDLSNVPEGERPRPGEAMELIGPHQSADDIARDAGTIGYEILTSLGHRYERKYI